MICLAEIETAKENLLPYVSIMFIQNRSALTSIANTLFFECFLAACQEICFNPAALSKYQTNQPSYDQAMLRQSKSANRRSEL